MPDASISRPSDLDLDRLADIVIYSEIAVVQLLRAGEELMH